MATYQYIARRPNGEEVTGVLDAEAEQEVLRTLDARQLFPVRISVRTGGMSLGRGGGGGGGGKVKPAVLTRMYGQLSDLLRAGVPILRCLDVMQRQTTKPRMKTILQDVHHDVADGTALADAFMKHANLFGELEISMVRAGERGGFLEDVLRRIATFREHQQEIKSRVTGAMVYPIMLLIFAFGVVTGLMLLVVPKFKGMFAKLESLPAPTVILFGISDFLRDNGLWLALGVGVVMMLSWPAIRSERGRRVTDLMKLRLPVFGPIIKSLSICRFCRILGTLLANGIPILTSLRIAKDSTGNRVLAEAVDEAADNIKAGDRLADPLAVSGHFPIDMIEMISIGEESNNLEEVLVNIAESEEIQTTRRIDMMVKLLEPALLLVMAGMVMFIVAALLLPVMKMTTMMRK